MSATSAPRSTSDSLRDGDRAAHPHSTRRLSTETKASFKTTEFFAFLAAVAGVLIAAGMVDEANNGGFGAKQHGCTSPSSPSATWSAAGSPSPAAASPTPRTVPSTRTAVGSCTRAPTRPAGRAACQPFRGPP
jgi:hypothetical protein